MNIWELSILKIFNVHPEGTSLKKTYQEIPHHIELTDAHYEIRWGVPEYQNQVRAHVDDLLDKKEVEKVKRGVYRITQRGKTRLHNTN